ncbi:MAG TPA: hypothetical protein VMV28_06160 [Thermoplasmata archaeon]|nr:hypothetical protein [Thermoplasmata archaeon]
MSTSRAPHPGQIHTQPSGAIGAAVPWAREPPEGSLRPPSESPFVGYMLTESVAEGGARPEALLPLELEPGEERIASWKGHAGSRAVVMVLTNRHLVTIFVKGVWNRSYHLASSRRLEAIELPRAHDAYGGRRLQIEGVDFSFSPASEDAVREEILRVRAQRVAAAPRDAPP